MPINPDFRDLLAAFNGHDVTYLVVGGYALSYRARPRTTKYLDVWVFASPSNAPRIWKAVQSFGAPLTDLTPKDLKHPGIVLQMGLPPNRIDLLTKIDGVNFEEAWPERQIGRYGDQPMPLLSRRLLIQNKRATGRTQDLADAEALEEFDD